MPHARLNDQESRLIPVALTFLLPPANAFELLAQNAIISQSCGTATKHLIGFRNIAVLSYLDIQRPILQAIVGKHLADFEIFLTELSL